MDMLQLNNSEDVSWESISIMAEASVIRERVDLEPDMEGSGGSKKCYPTGYFDELYSGYIWKCGDACINKWQEWKGEGRKRNC